MKYNKGHIEISYEKDKPKYILLSTKFNDRALIEIDEFKDLAKLILIHENEIFSL